MLQEFLGFIKNDGRKWVGVENCGISFKVFKEKQNLGDYWGQIGEVGYDSVLKKKSWILSYEVVWKGKRLIYFF